MMRERSKIFWTRDGFTLIELLVVIAIIALLIAILIPSLKIAKRKAATAVCLVNTKNLSLAWYMYQSDNDGKLVNATMGSTGWIGRPCDKDGTIVYGSIGSPVTDEDEIRGIEKGLLFSYTENPKVFHCPADNIRRAVDDKSRIFLSYAIARCLNGLGSSSSQVKKFGRISSPSLRYNFVEMAMERNVSDSFFMLAAPEYSSNPNYGWWSPLALNHGDSSVLGFCDGHSEPRKWREESTKLRAEKLSRQNTASYNKIWPGDPDWPADELADIIFMTQGWAYRHR